MKIGGTTQPIETIITNYSFNFPIAKSNMKLLHNFLPTVPRVIPNFNNYVNTLDSMNNQLANQKNQRRLSSATEIIFDVLKYLGYLSLGIITLYTLYKVGCLKIVAKLLPKNVYIKIYCNETSVSNDPQRRVMNTYNADFSAPGVISKIPLFQLENDSREPQYPHLKPTSSYFDLSNIKIPKIVRFKTKSNLRKEV